MLAALGRLAAVGAADPLVLAAVAVGVLTLVAGGWALKRYLEAPVDRFCRLLRKYDEVVVLMHPNPDPDAMASAMAVAHLAESVGTEVTLQHAGSVKHHENQAFVAAFDLEFEPIEDANWLACRDVVLVDHNEPRGFAGARGLDPIAVVDHHPGDGTGTRFTDVRSEYGACATILSEYLEEYLGDEPLPAPLATALLYGIQADTKHLTRGCTNAEFDAGARLHEYADPALLDKVATPPVPEEFLDVQARAIVNRHVVEPVALSDVGDVETVDTIAAAAEELLRLEGVSTVVVYGTNDETLHLSGRSRDGDVHIGNALEAAVEGIPMASAGGHARMGGGQVSIPHLDGIGPGPGVSEAEFRERLFEAIGAVPETDAPTPEEAEDTAAGRVDLDGEHEPEAEQPT